MPRPTATVTVTATDTATPSIVLGNVTQPGSPNMLSLEEGTDPLRSTRLRSRTGPPARVRIAMPNPHADKLTLSTSRLSLQEPGGN